MYYRMRQRMQYIIICAIYLLSFTTPAIPKSIISTEKPVSVPIDDSVDNNIIDFDEEYSIKFNKKFGAVPWHGNEDFKKESHRYTIIKGNENTKLNNDKRNNIKTDNNETQTNTTEGIKNIDTTESPDYSVIPLELITTTENVLLSIIESTTEPDLTVIPLSTTKKNVPETVINQTVTLPTSTQTDDTTIEYTTTINRETTTESEAQTKINPSSSTQISIFTEKVTRSTTTQKTDIVSITVAENDNSTAKVETEKESADTKAKIEAEKESINTTTKSDDTSLNTSTTTEVTTNINLNTTTEKLVSNTTEMADKNVTTVDPRSDTGSVEDEKDVPLYTELDTEEHEVPEDYYDSKDIIPTTPPKTDALSVLFGFAGSMVESVAERVVPKTIFDLFKRMQKQSEALEAERLRSREENGGLGQFGRGILKSISSGIGKPLSQLMQGVRDIGSLDTDRGFINSLASGVTSVANAANSVVDSFKDRVQAIYPGTVWCGDGHSATARSSDLGLFFFTDTCCRQHDACKIYIKAGETKYGLTNTGLFTRSHCSCDTQFRECLRRTNSLVSGQIGLTYFNVLGPQCFRKAHPIVRCVRKTRITGQKCEEYELDYTKPKMWQWFDNETF